MPTDKEEVAIQRGIAQDPDNPERDDDWFAKAQAASEVVPSQVYADLTRRRGPGKRPAKVSVTLRLAPDVVAGLRASGPGWQSRANAALRKIATR